MPTSSAPATRPTPHTAKLKRVVEIEQLGREEIAGGGRADRGERARQQVRAS